MFLRLRMCTPAQDDEDETGQGESEDEADGVGQSQRQHRTMDAVLDCPVYIGSGRRVALRACGWSGQVGPGSGNKQRRRRPQGESPSSSSSASSGDEGPSSSEEEEEEEEDERGDEVYWGFDPADKADERGRKTSAR